MSIVYTSEYLEQKLKSELEATYAKVDDLSDGCGAKFGCVVVSNKFEGMPLLARHRLVNAALAKELETIHAFSQKTFTEAQYEKQKDSL
ncbi:BolA-like protein 2 [Lamellibrachia satsuma]|nr:BolA-like protein 2 [Lamellibrachia satsuma]